MIKRVSMSVSANGAHNPAEIDVIPKRWYTADFLDDHVTLMVQSGLVPTRDQIYTEQGGLTCQ